MLILLITLFIVSDTLKLTLADAKQIALKNNPDYRVQVIATSYDKDDFYKNIVTNIMQPSLTAYSGAKFGFLQQTGYYFDFTLDQPVFDTRVAANILGSKFQSNASNASLREARNFLLYQIESFYLSCLKADRLLQLSEKAVKRAEANLRVITKKLEVGEATRLDLLNAKVYLNRAKLNLSNANKSRELTKRVLLNALGIYRPCTLLLEPVEVKEEQGIPPLDSLMTVSLHNRAKLMATRQKLNAAKIGFAGSVLSVLPTVSFRHIWSYNSVKFPESVSEMMDGITSSSGWSMSLNLNLFSYPFDVREGRKALKMEQLKFLNERLRLVKDVKEAWLDCTSMERDVELAQSTLEVAKEGYELAKAQYELGLISSLELFTAETDLLDAEVTYVSTLYDYRLAKTRLRFVTGGQL